MEEERRSRSTKLKTSIDNLKDCTAQILAQAAALAKASMRVSVLLFIAEYVGPAARADGRAGGQTGGRASACAFTEAEGGVFACLGHTLCRWLVRRCLAFWFVFLWSLRSAFYVVSLDFLLNSFGFCTF